MGKIQSFQFLGHAAVVLNAQDYVVAIDPWLQGNPSCPAHLKNPSRLDLIVVTHGHSDHAGDVVRLAKECKAKVAAPFELATHFAAAGVPESHLEFMNKGGSATIGPVRVTLTHAFHSSSYETASGLAPAGEPCGVVIQDEVRSFYHSGDTALFSDMSLIAETYRPEVGFLCCGDRFTMGPHEAARAASLLKLQRAVPIHYGTFPQLVQTAEEFAAACRSRGVTPVPMRPGESVAVS